ncbi:MAG: EscV/YscV/HrcV family type III secretion system export apparatus protein, partial [Alphaproteobacteria bacterium]
EEAKVQEAARVTEEEARNSVRESLKTVEIELCLGKQISASFIQTHSELAQRVAKMRRKFAKQYGFVVPEIRLSDDLSIPPKAYQIKIHGTMVASEELRIGDVLVITGDGPRPDMPCDDAREPAFGMKA